MSQGLAEGGISDIIKLRFDSAGIPNPQIDVREYPQETIVVVRVSSVHFARAVDVGNVIDTELRARNFPGFVTVRRLDGPSESERDQVSRGVSGAAADRLAQLLTARARTTELQPSLAYKPDAANNLSAILSSRHHLIFGRRGAGKTALMVEAKRILQSEGNSTLWINLHTHRGQKAGTIFLWAVQNLCDLLLQQADAVPSDLSVRISQLRDHVDSSLAKALQDDLAASVIPRIQSVLRAVHKAQEKRLFIFFDDLHYLERSEQPKLLDQIHSAVRDCDVWLKVATIKHLSRWFEPNPPMGLQTGHDADHVDLDVTLQNPGDAKQFLEAILKSYAQHLGIARLSWLFSADALDRLILASGAVPRDYLVLAGRTLREAKKRPRAQLVGVQDVNRAAGEAAQVNLTELEEDAASTQGSTTVILAALRVLRRFCLEEKRCAFFRIDFRDKERHVAQYALLQSLMDLRLLHLVNPSLSDQHEAGHRFEVFTLDLSQFTGHRFKRNLRVLDFVDGEMVLKETGVRRPSKVGNTPRKLLDLLRRGPIFGLAALQGAPAPDAAP